MAPAGCLPTSVPTPYIRWTQVLVSLFGLLALMGCGFRSPPVDPPAVVLAPTVEPTTAVTATPAAAEILRYFPPLTAYRAGLRGDQVDLLEDLHHLPRYEIAVDLFPDRNALQGQAAIAIVNSSTQDWSQIVFRLPANMPRLEANMQINAVAVNGQDITPIMTASPTVLTVPLPSPLAPGQWVKVDLAWQLQYTHHQDSLAAYIVLGGNQDMISLPHFYPELAVFAPGAPGTTDGWWTTEIPDYADIRFHTATLMRVSASAPRNLVVVGSGTPTTSVARGQDRVHHSWVTGPVRGFVLQASPAYVMSSLEADGVVLQSFHHPADEAVARQTLGYARTALQTFERYFGPYPYPQLLVVSSPLDDRGMEYSGLVQMGVNRYRNHPDNTAWLMIHEVAHQWWYLQVHNDPVHWVDLDEGLAELSYLFWLDEVLDDFSRENISIHWRSQIHQFDTAYAGDVPWWRPATYADLVHYYRAHYTRPAAFLEAAWTLAGDAPFRAALRTYVADNRFQIVTFQDLADALNQTAQDERMAALLQAWLSTEQPLP